MNTNPLRPFRLLALSLGVFAATLLLLANCGCTTVQRVVNDDATQLLFNHALDRLQARLEEKAIAATNTPPIIATDTTADAVDYAALRWEYGGADASKSPLDATVRIKDLSFNRSTLFYAWESGGCEELGADGRGDHNATICAAFFKDADGIWRGGKFDWISTSRTSRGLHHITGPGYYENWASASIQNPTEACFVIVSVRTGTRSNVIKSTWRR